MNSILSFVPILILWVAEYLLTGILCYIYTILYYKMNPPHDMILISGGVNGLTIKKKMEVGRYPETGYPAQDIGKQKAQN